MTNDDKKPDIYDLGFDRHLYRKDVVEEKERQFQQRIKNERDDIERRERIRTQRIAASGKSPLLYTLDVIIEKCVVDEKYDRIEIDFSSLGFTEEVASAAHFFDQLKNAGCFESFERCANTWFVVTKPNIEKLREFKTQLNVQLNGEETKREKAHKFPHKLPAGTTWKNITMRFVSDEAVVIEVKGHKVEATFREMGFSDSRTKPLRPSVGWAFLKVLALRGGEIAITDSEAKGTYKKQKQLVAEALQSYFSIEPDSFYPYHATNSYKVRMTLFSAMPEGKLRRASINMAEEEVDSEIKQYFTEQTPQIYENNDGEKR